MFKSTTDIKKKRHCHTHVHSQKGNKKHMKGTEAPKDDMISHSLLQQRHLPRYQNHTATQTDAPQLRSYEVKGYSGITKKGNKNNG